MKNIQIQQGDCLFEQIGKLPKGVKSITDRVLRHGESGNRHELIGDAEVFEYKGQKFIAVGSDGASLVHGEHAISTFPPNSFHKMLDGVYEYDYDTEEAKRVID